MDLQHQPTLDALRNEMEALFACACLFHGNRQRYGDVVFVPGLAVDNWQSAEEDTGVLTVAADLFNRFLVEFVVIPGYTGTYQQGRGGPRSETGYPGGATWKSELMRLGVPDDRVELSGESDFGPTGESHNTLTEVNDFLRLAKARGWTQGIIVGTPFHLPRVMLTLVKAMQREAYRMRLFPITPRSVSWKKRVYHSQGLQQLPRYAHIAEEWSRIPRYQENESICSFQELREYLESLHKET